jgi:predicted kinase
MKVTILRGISGAGKTTWVKANAKEAVVVSADHFFLVDGEYRFDANKLQEAHVACFRRFMEAVLKKEPWIVVDNTNVSAWESAPYVLAGESYGYTVELLTLACTVEVSLSRKQQLAPESLRRMHDRVLRETASMPPRFKSIHRIIETC